jgi:hypothetical protein
MFKPPTLINGIESIVVFLRAQALRLTYPKYFHNDPEGYQALPFSDVLGSMTTKLEKGESKWTLTTSYQGDSRPTTIFLLNGFDAQKPSLIYHHGAGSTKPLRDFNFIFGQGFPSKFNVFIVHAQYHASKQEYLNNSVDSFLHNQETFAGSVLAYEEIVKYHHSQSKQMITATGSSMGGIVSSLHAFYFGSADYYFPLVAYPNVGEIFMGDAYKTAVADWESKRQNESYQNSFTIKQINPELRSKVFPILGSADHIVPFERSSKFWQDNGFSIKVFPYGHFTPGIAGREIRSFISEKSNLNSK